jgi:hypothetical protein
MATSAVDIALPAPDRAGLGVEVKWADLEPYRVYGSHQQAPARH